MNLKMLDDIGIKLLIVIFYLFELCPKFFLIILKMTYKLFPKFIHWFLKSKHCNLNKLTREEDGKLWNEMGEGYGMTHNPLDDCRFQSRIYHNLCKKVGIEL